jgi:glycosyltransferase involved in cell wall biosynthesis
MRAVKVSHADAARPVGAYGALPLRLAFCAAGEIWGGVERFLLTMAPALRAAGLDPLVILFHDALLARKLRAARVRVEVLDGYARYDVRIVGHLRRLLRQDAVNLLHVHGYRATIAGALAARELPLKIVKTEHGCLEPPCGWNDVPAYMKLAANIAVERIASHCVVDATVFVSRDLQSRLPRPRSSTARRVIYNGIDLASTSPARSRRHHGTFRIGIVGRVDAVKGHLHLLRALARLDHLPDIRLHVFGTGPLEHACKRLSTELGLDERVAFEGFDPAIHQRMAALDLLVMPSLHEGLPYVLLEAMALRVPVVASAVGGIREAFDEDECAILVPPGDEALLAQAIERLHQCRELRTEMAQRAYRAVQSRFLASQMIRQYLDLYRDVLEQ